MDAFLKFFQLLPQHFHGLLYDVGWGQRTYRLNLENKSIFLLSDLQKVLQVSDVQGLSCLLALTAIDTTVWVNNFKNSLMNLKHISRTGFGDGILLKGCQLDISIILDIRIRIESC